MSATRYGPPPPDWPPTSAPRHSAPEPPAPPRRRKPRRADASPWNWLLLLPIALPLMPFLYNRIEPTLFGLPFFYWSQLGFAFLASVTIAIVHMKVR